MEISRTLQPGEMGTKRLLSQYGDQLVCVRYRIDRSSQKRLTTVELIIDEKPFIEQKSQQKAWLRIDYNEIDLRNKVKTSGARWLAEQKVWEMDLATAMKMRLKDRIVKRLT